MIKPIIFWVSVIVCLTLGFGVVEGDLLKSFLFVTFLMPAAMGTSYLFNLILVPKFLLKGKYFSFGLYLLYTLIFSLYLEMLALALAFIFLGNFQFDNLNPYATDLIALTSILYLIVFIDGFISLIKKYRNNQHDLLMLQEGQEKDNLEKIIVRSDRKNIPIQLDQIHYLESLSDYVQIHLTDQKIITKEKISEFEEQLPSWFIRTHRSFIINTHKVSSFTQEQIHLANGECLPISRTYKKSTLVLLNQEKKELYS